MEIVSTKVLRQENARGRESKGERVGKERDRPVLGIVSPDLSNVRISSMFGCEVAGVE